jgi:hypothetical protein
VRKHAPGGELPEWSGELRNPWERSQAGARVPSPLPDEGRKAGRGERDRANTGIMSTPLTASAAARSVAPQADWADIDREGVARPRFRLRQALCPLSLPSTQVRVERVADLGRVATKKNSGSHQAAAALPNCCLFHSTSTSGRNASHRWA